MQLRNWFTSIAALALLLLPLPAEAVITTLDVTTPSEAVPSATLEIFDVEEPEKVVVVRKVETPGPVQVDLPEEKVYGVRIKEGPVVVERFESGDDVEVPIPWEFLRSALGWTFSVGLKGAYSSHEVEGGIDIPFIADASNHDDVGGGVFIPEFEIMAPPCGNVWGDPRLFVRIGGDVGSADEQIVSEDIDGFLETSLEAQMRSSWNFALGVQLSAYLAGQEIRFKPAVAYGQQTHKLTGNLYEFDPGLASKEHQTAKLHFIRPELSIETPIVSHDPFEVAAFIFGGVDLKVGGGSENFMVRGAGGSVDYHFRSRRVGYSVGGGIRLLWSPFALR